MTSLNAVSMVTKNTCRHVVGQAMFGILSKIYVPSKPTSVNRRSNRLVGYYLIQNASYKKTSTTTNYANVADDC